MEEDIAATTTGKFVWPKMWRGEVAMYVEGRAFLVVVVVMESGDWIVRAYRGADEGVATNRLS